MIALAASLALALYLVIPSSLFRLTFGLYLPLRNFVRSRGEEILQGVLSTILPFLLAWVCVWTVPFFTRHPFGFADTTQLRIADYRTVFAGIYNPQSFRRSGEAFWDALSRTVRRQERFLAWYYIFAALEGLSAGYLSVSYPTFERIPGYERFAQKILLPNISAWHVLLKPFFFSKKETPVVWADVLCCENILYRGVVSEHFVDKDGQLMGLILTDARRFRRDDYLKEKERNPGGIKTQDFWRLIPGSKLYIVGEKILNLNLSYTFPTPQEKTLQEMIEMVSDELKQPVTVTFLRQDRPATSPPPQEPK